MEIQQCLEDSTSRENGFQKHPSVLLNTLYKEKNHQGADPKTANVLFVGRDPNWAIDVENMSMFHFVSDYLTDGVHFWKTHSIHHPFLFTSYKGDGKRYHTIFSKLKLDSKHSSQISFIELIGFPTTGMAKKDNKSFQCFLISDINRSHLIQLDSLINDLNKTFFIAWGLIDDFQFIYKKTGLFKKFANLDKRNMDINDLNEFENVFIHKHFSDSISNNTINKISEKANLFLNKSL